MMKTRRNLLSIICLLSLLGLSTSCNKDFSSDDLDGRWRLDLVNQAFTSNWGGGAYTWDFDLANNKLTVIKPEDEELGFFDSGTYDFTLSGSLITTSSVEVAYDLKENAVFIFDNQVVDGLSMRLVRD